MELSLHDSEFSSMDPSYLAACALNLSFKLFKGPKWVRFYFFSEIELKQNLGFDIFLLDHRE
jgi:hypothetical protein